MSELKTKATDVKVEDFLNLVEPAQKREDAFTLLQLMRKVTGNHGKMWGPSIVGFGKYHYKYESGHEGDSYIAGFSPRKTRHVVYLMPGFYENEELLKRLGKYKASKGCLYINKLEDVDLATLEQLIRKSIDDLKKAPWVTAYE